MDLNNRSRARKGLAIAAAVTAALVGTNALNPARSAAATHTDITQRVGIVCTTSDDNSFDLETKDGYINLPDGNTAYMWGYSLVGQPFQHPSPVLCADENSPVTVRLHNTFSSSVVGQAAASKVSIMFPGQENVLADGVAAQPEITSGQVSSLTTSAATGSTVTYSFTADHAGTFLYESGTDPETQVRMGFFGTLIVRPVGHHDMAYSTHVGRVDSTFTLNEEFLILLSEIDPFQHQAVENHQTFNLNTYKPRYWLVNGRGFPDSIADNYATWLPSQPYGSLASIKPYDATTHPHPGLARYLNVGTEDYPFHPHGNNGSVIGQNGHPLEDVTTYADLSAEKFSLNIGPGQTWDVLFKWFDAEGYSPTNPVPVTVPNVANQVFGMFYSGSPYLGQQGTLPPNTSTLNQCGEFYIIAHNHALYQITSWGVNMTGPITYMRVNPPTGTCG